MDFGFAVEKYCTSEKFDPQFLKKVLDMAFLLIYEVISEKIHSYMRRFWENCIYRPDKAHCTVV